MANFGGAPLEFLGRAVPQPADPLGPENLQHYDQEDVQIEPKNSGDPRTSDLLNPMVDSLPRFPASPVQLPRGEAQCFLVETFVETQDLGKGEPAHGFPASPPHFSRLFPVIEDGGHGLG